MALPESINVTSFGDYPFTEEFKNRYSINNVNIRSGGFGVGTSTGEFAIYEFSSVGPSVVLRKVSSGA